MTRLMITDLSPDGVRIVVDWSKFLPGTYIFIPCVNTKRAIDDLVAASGISKENIIIDPGIGFGKRLEDNYEILRRLNELEKLGCPILIGPSRKSFIGKVLNLEPDQRLEGTAAAVALGIKNGAHIVRVHDVKEMVRVCRIADLIVGKTSIKN